MAKNVVILGGGISGLSAAWALSDKGIDVDIIERNPFVGGLAGTIRQDGYCIDFGPHSFFSEEAWVVEKVLELFEYPFEPIPRTVKFLYKNKYLDYPLTPRGVLLQMGLMSGIYAALSYLKARLFRLRRSSIGTAQETVEDWAISSFGEHLYKNFFKPYTEQFWKVSCSQLSSRSIPTHTKMSFFNTLRMLLHRKFTKTGESLIERESLPTYYPRTGFAEFPEKIAQTVQKLGGKIHLNSEVAGVEELNGGKVRVIYNNNDQQKEIEGDYVISTIPLSSFVGALTPKPPAEVAASAGRLDYRSLVVLGMVTEKQNILGCGYIYVLDRPYNRITEMNEFSTETSPAADNIILVEIPCLYNSAAWNASKEELFDMCISSLAEDGFLGPGDVKRLLVAKTPHAYPIYRKDYYEHLERVLSYLNGCSHISTLGRCGEFMYMDIDVCLKRAFDFVENRIGVFQD
jgi:protoporphyrinogen oxidase